MREKAVNYLLWAAVCLGISVVGKANKFEAPSCLGDQGAPNFPMSEPVGEWWLPEDPNPQERRVVEIVREYTRRAEVARANSPSARYGHYGNFYVEPARDSSFTYHHPRWDTDARYEVPGFALNLPAAGEGPFDSLSHPEQLYLVSLLNAFLSENIRYWKDPDLLAIPYLSYKVRQELLRTQTEDEVQSYARELKERRQRIVERFVAPFRQSGGRAALRPGAFLLAQIDGSGIPVQAADDYLLVQQALMGILLELGAPVDRLKLVKIAKCNLCDLGTAIRIDDRRWVMARVLEFFRQGELQPKFIFDTFSPDDTVNESFPVPRPAFWLIP
jgi:hypothetical protein